MLVAAPPSTTRSRRPEEFAALADYAVDDFMSEAASEVEVFSTTEGHGKERRRPRSKIHYLMIQGADRVVYNIEMKGPFAYGG